MNNKVDQKSMKNWLKFKKFRNFSRTIANSSIDFSIKDFFRIKNFQKPSTVWEKFQCDWKKVSLTTYPMNVITGCENFHFYLILLSQKNFMTRCGNFLGRLLLDFRVTVNAAIFSVFFIRLEVDCGLLSSILSGRLLLLGILVIFKGF